MGLLIRLTTILPALALALVLVWYGAVGFNRALQDLPAHGVLDDLGRGIAVADDRIEAAERSLAGAPREHPWALKQRAQFALRNALNGDTDPSDTDRQLRSARQWLIDGLSEAPSDAYAWLWLTQTEFLVHGHSSLARQSLAMSWQQSPHFSPLALGQVDYGLLLWPSLDTEARERVKTQLTLIATSDAQATADIARRRGAVAIDHFRQVLATHPWRLRVLERELTQSAPVDQ